jgi:hypothetical protein
MIVATYNTIPSLLQLAALVDDLVLAFIKPLLMASIFVALISLLKSACHSAVVVLWTIVRVLSSILYLLQLLQLVLDKCFTRENLWRLFYGTYVVLAYCLLVDIGAFSD